MFYIALDNAEVQVKRVRSCGCPRGGHNVPEERTFDGAMHEVSPTLRKALRPRRVAGIVLDNTGIQPVRVLEVRHGVVVWKSNVLIPSWALEIERALSSLMTATPKSPSAPIDTATHSASTPATGCRLTLVPLRPSQRLADQSLLMLLSSGVSPSGRKSFAPAGPPARGRLRSQHRFQLDVGRLQRPLCRQYQTSLNHVLQLAHVPRPVIID